VLGTQANGVSIKLTDKVFSSTLTGTCTKVNGSIIKPTALEFTKTRMVPVTKVIGKMIFSREKELRFGQTGPNSKVTIKAESNKVQASTRGKMGRLTMVK
jgi:hypothetical protein